MLRQFLYKYFREHIFSMSIEDRKELLDFTAFLQREN
jgi:hypothetical protein